MSDQPLTLAAQRLLADLLGRYGGSVLDPVSDQLTREALIAIEQEAAALAAQPTPPLDVERMAELLAGTGSYDFSVRLSDWTPEYRVFMVDQTRRILDAVFDRMTAEDRDGYAAPSEPSGFYCAQCGTPLPYEDAFCSVHVDTQGIYPALSEPKP